MKIFLNSQGFISIRKKGEKVGTVIDEKNHFLQNLKDSIKKYDLFVLVCNNPDEYERNDRSAFFIAQAFNRQLAKFKEVVVLDGRNEDKSKEYLSNADFVFLCGGKIECQNEFLKKIEFKKNINQNAVVVGVSAGAMNLCEFAYNYPEDITELNNKKWISGLGYSDKVIIPHFKRWKGNMYHPRHYNLLKKWFLPDSYEKEFLCLPNGSYVMIDERKETLYGKSYLIKNGAMQKICENEKSLRR